MIHEITEIRLRLSALSLSSSCPLECYVAVTDRCNFDAKNCSVFYEALLVISVMFEIFRCLKHVSYLHHLEFSCAPVFRQLVVLILTDCFI